MYYAGEFKLNRNTFQNFCKQLKNLLRIKTSPPRQSSVCPSTCTLFCHCTESKYS